MAGRTAKPWETALILFLYVRAGLLLSAWIWSLWLAGGILRREAMSRLRLALAIGSVAAGGMLAAASWALLFWVR